MLYFYLSFGVDSALREAQTSMSSFLVTIIAAVILIALAILGLGIGYLITGKTKFSYRKCGYNPNAKDSNCKNNNKCDLCGKNKGS